jgi:hypothetical protein
MRVKHSGGEPAAAATPAQPAITTVLIQHLRMPAAAPMKRTRERSRQQIHPQLVNVLDL